MHTSKRDYARATVVEVVEPSPHRVSPPCPALAAGCGGCAWQHVASDAQLELKAAVVADALRRTAKLPDAAVHLGAAVPPWGYRTTLRLAVASDSDGPTPAAPAPTGHPLPGRRRPDRSRAGGQPPGGAARRLPGGPSVAGRDARRRAGDRRRGVVAARRRGQRRGERDGAWRARQGACQRATGARRHRRHRRWCTSRWPGCDCG